MSMRVNNIYTNTSNYELKSRKTDSLEGKDESIFTAAKENNNSTNVNNIQEDEQKEVSFQEGFSLICNGFVDKLKNMVTGIVQHPIKTIAMVGATAGLIAAAPIIGITSATAGAVLAVGFGVYAIGKTAFDVVEAVKDNNEGRYDEVRQDLTEIGGDGVDLALTLPFMPKAIKQISRFAKFGTSTVGLNTQLIKNIAKNGNVSMELAKANTAIEYEMIGNEMGLAVKPELEFYTSKISSDGTMLGAQFDPVSGKIKFNQELLTGKGKLMAKSGGVNSEITLRHELEHFEQFSEIAKSGGVESIQGALKQYYSAVFKSNGGTFELIDGAERIQKLQSAENCALSEFDAQSEEIFAKLFNGEITFDEFESMYSKEFNNCWKNNVQPITDEYVANVEKNWQVFEKMSKQGFDYLNSENITLKDGSCINTEFWQNVIDSNTIPETQAGNSAKYIEAFINKGAGIIDEEAITQAAKKYGINLKDGGFMDSITNPQKFTKFQLELYKSNLLENEAYTAQELFQKQYIKGRPNVVTDGIDALAIAEDCFSENDKTLKEGWNEFIKNKYWFIHSTQN